MKKAKVLRKSLAVMLSALLMLALLVPASAYFEDTGALIKFHTGTGADDSMGYKSLKYSQYGDANAFGPSAAAVIMDDQTLAETWTARLYDDGDGSAAALQTAIAAGSAKWLWSTGRVETAATLIGGGAADPTQLGDIVRFDKTFTIDGNQNDPATLYIAADNGCVVLVNGTMVYFSDTLFAGTDRAAVKANLEAALADGIDNIASLFPNLTQDKVTTDGWQLAKAVAITVDAELFVTGENTITVIGFNEEMTAEDNSGTVGTPYLNPAGVVFTLEVPYTKTPSEFDFGVVKYDIAGRLLTDEIFHFVAYTQIDNKGKPVASSKVAEADTNLLDGTAYFTDFAPGRYYIFEELSDVRNQKGRFKPYNQPLTPGRVFEFIIVDIDADNPPTQSFIFINDYARTKVDVTKAVGFQPATTELSFWGNTPIGPWQMGFSATKEVLTAADTNLDIGVVLADRDNMLFNVGSLNVSKKADGKLYGTFTPSALCPALAAGAEVSIETAASTVTSYPMLANQEFVIADAAEIASLFEEGAASALITLSANVVNANQITIPSQETFYLRFKGPAFPAEGKIYAITPGAPLVLALFWGDYTVEEVTASGEPVTGYAPVIKATVQSKYDDDFYHDPDITYTGAFTIHRLCDKVKIEVLNRLLTR